MSLHRFHVPRAAPGARVTLPDHTAHHAREVLRLRAGAAVRVFDGAGLEWDGVLEEVSRRSVTARLLHAAPARPESPLHLVLAVAPLKGDRMELVIQKATELGVSADLAGGDLPHRRRRPPSAQRLARRALGTSGVGRRGAVRARCGPAPRSHDHPGRTDAAPVRRGTSRLAGDRPDTSPSRPLASIRRPRCCCWSARPAASKPRRPTPSAPPGLSRPLSARASSAPRPLPWPRSRSPRPRGGICGPDSGPPGHSGVLVHPLKLPRVAC